MILRLLLFLIILSSCTNSTGFKGEPREMIQKKWV